MNISIKKKLVPSVFSALLSLATSTAIAETSWNIVPYVGTDAEWRHMNFRKSFGDNVFRHNYPQAAPYVGLKFNDYVGVEAGYEATARKSRAVTFSARTIVNGVPENIPGLTSVQYVSTGQIKGPYLKLVSFIPICEVYKLTLIGTLGVARLHAKFNNIVISVNNLPDFDPDTFIQKKTVLQLGAGLQQMINENWGVRAIIKWEQTSKFKNISSQEDVMAGHRRINTIKMKDSYIFSIGAFVKFY